MSSLPTDPAGAGPVSTPVHLVVMGVSGSGKTTVGGLLVKRFGWPFVDADTMHPPANIAKMSRSEPLTDQDRWPWLVAMRDWMSGHAAAGRSTISTCSALKRSYRDVLRTAEGRVRFVFLTGDAQVIGERLRTRGGHFMPAALLASQYADLELLTPDEDAVTVEVDASPAAIADAIVAALGELPARTA